MQHSISSLLNTVYLSFTVPERNYIDDLVFSMLSVPVTKKL